MATSKITKTISDIKFIQNTGTTKFSIDAGAGVDVVLSGYVTIPATPSGYTIKESANYNYRISATFLLA